MTCAGCLNPTGGLYVTGCRQCSLRDISRGPEHFASMRAKVLTPAYMARLQALGPIADVHAEVKALIQSGTLKATP